MDSSNPPSVKTWKTRAEKAIAWGKIGGAAITFLAAFYAAFMKPTDDRKTKAVYETVKPVIELLESQNRHLEDRLAVLEYRMAAVASSQPPLPPEPAPASPVAVSHALPIFSKERPLPPHVPSLLRPHPPSHLPAPPPKAGGLPPFDAF